MAIGDFINRFRQKSEKYSERAGHDPEEQYDSEGNPKYSFEKGLPDFLDPKNSNKDKDRQAFKDYIQSVDEDFLPTLEDILAGTNTDLIEPEQFEAFTKHVAAFQEKWEAAEKLAAKVDDKMVERMAKNSNRGAFGTIVYAYGVDTMGKIWRENMTRLIVNDEDKFEKLQTALNEYEKNVLLGDHLIKSGAERLGIKEAKYEDIMADPDPDMRREKLRAALNTKYEKPKNRWGKFWSYASQEAKRKAESGRKDLEAALILMDEQIAAIGELLADATSDNSEIQQAVFAAIKA